MVKYENEYRDFLETQGVGKKDSVASSPAQYVSDLNTVSRLICEDVTPTNLKTEDDVVNLANRIVDERAAKTIGNYKSAMRQYVATVSALGLH